MKLYYYLDLPQIRTCFLSWEQGTRRSLTLNLWLECLGYIGVYQITASDLQIMPSQCWLRASTESPASGSAFCRGVETTQPAAGLIAWGWQTSYSLKNQDGRLRFWSNLFRVRTVRICFRYFPYANVCEIGSTSNWMCQVILGTMRHLLDQEHAQQCQESQGGWTQKLFFLTLKWQCWGQKYWQTLRKYCISYEPIGGILFSFKSISSEGWRSWFTIHSATCTELYMI